MIHVRTTLSAAVLATLATSIYACSGDVAEVPAAPSADAGQVVTKPSPGPSVPDASASDAATPDASTMTDAGDDGGGACTLKGTTKIAACDACVEENCCAEGNECFANKDCLDLAQCAIPCGSDTACLGKCGLKYPKGYTTFQKVAKCAAKPCATTCL